MDRPGWAPETIDIERPSAARIYDYLLGGSHNFAADREAARKVIALAPEAPLRAQANRAFLRRTVAYLIEAGVRQFLDIGSGIPTVGNVHEIAHQVAPDAKVVYVDMDPIAIAHSQELLADDPRTIAIQEDLRTPERIINHPAVRELFDFSQPIAVLIVAVLHFVEDRDQPTRAIATIRDTLPPGSYLVLSHADTEDIDRDKLEAGAQIYRRGGSEFTSRGAAEIAAFFDGFELVEPGLVWVPLWRPDSTANLEDPAQSILLGGVGRLRG